mgnify:CR=1 FL=1
MIDAILLDVDGVLADFFGGVCKAFGNDALSVASSLNYHVPWDLSQVFPEFKGETVTEICSEDFWSSLDLYGWAEPLVEALKKTFPGVKIQLCTSAGKPSTQYFKHAVNGKIRWLKQHFPELVDDTIFCFDKRYIVGRKTVLIDDNQVLFDDDSVIPFPQWWNDYREIRNKSVTEIVGHVMNGIKRVSEMDGRGETWSSHVDI